MPFVVASINFLIRDILCHSVFRCLTLDDAVAQVAAEPSGLLPMQFPADMRTVEEQQEDVPHDMRPLKDADGNVWDFAHGLNWSGPIEDGRTAKYRPK